MFRFKMGTSSDVGINKAILKTKRRRGLYEVMAARSKTWKSSRGLITNEHYDMLPASVPTYVNIDAGPSMMPTKKYCDFTGFPANYTDPVNKLRFVSKEAFRKGRRMQEHKIEDFLTLRNAQIRIK